MFFQCIYNSRIINEIGSPIKKKSPISDSNPHQLLASDQCNVKSVQSALSDLLTASATHGTFSRPSTKRGLILIGLEVITNARESFEHC